MKRIKIVIAAATAMLLAGVAGAQSVNDVIEKYNEAVELITNKNYEEAIPVLNAAIELGLEVGPDAMENVTAAQKLLPACFFRVGLAHARANENDQAFEALGKAIELGELYGDTESTANAKTLIGQLYTKMGGDAFNSKDYPRAAEIFAQGYEANPTDTQLALNLALSYGEMEDYENCYRVYGDIIELGEKHSKYKEAADQAREKIGYYSMLEANEAIKNNDTDKAYSILGDLLEKDPSNATASMMMIQVANNNKNWDKVVEYGEIAATAQTTPELTSDAYFLLGVAYQNKNNNPKAVEAFRKVTAGSNVATARTQAAALAQ